MNIMSLLSCLKCGHEIRLEESQCPNCGSKRTIYMRCLILIILLIIIWFIIRPANTTAPVSIARNNTTLKYTVNSLIFGTALTPDFTIKNLNNFPIKNITINCDEIDSNGKIIDSMKYNISEVIPSKGTKTLLQIDIGNISNQTTSITCNITSVDTALK